MPSNLKVMHPNLSIFFFFAPITLRLLGILIFLSFFLCSYYFKITWHPNLSIFFFFAPITLRLLGKKDRKIRMPSNLKVIGAKKKKIERLGCHVILK
jgi:hypothetical protein